MPIDPSAAVAPTARVHPEAVIGPRVLIGDFAIVEQDVVIGAETRLESYVYVKRWTTLGERNEISAGTVLGTDPLDRNFNGDENYIMTSGHIAHNCRIGNQTVIASCALVAGHVDVESQAFISGGVVIHQHSKIGRLAMIGGNTRVNSDVPPYFLYSDFDVAAKGLNLVGLRRAGFSAADVAAL